MVAAATTTKQRAAISKTRLRLWLRLLHSARLIESEIRHRLRREFAATLPRFDVMAALYRQPGGMMMSEISRYLMVSNGNVTGIVERLVKDDLATRFQRDGDRRSWIICLTKKGTRNFEQMAAAHERWIDELFGEFSADEAEQLRGVLLRLTAHTEAEP